MNIPELITYWRVIRKRWWLISLLVGVTVGTILIIAYMSKPLYKASTLFQVTAPLPAEVPLVNEFRLATNRDELLYTKNDILKLLQDETVAWQVIEDLNLNMEATELLTTILVEADEFSDFIKLSVTAESPEQAAAIANTLMTNTTQYFGELNARSIIANRKFIQQLLQEVKAKLDEANETLIQFQIENKVGSLDGVLRSQESLITELKLKRDEALAQGEEAKAENYDQIIAIRQQELQDLIRLGAEYHILQSAVDRIESTYSDLLGKEIEVKLKEDEIASARFIRVIPAREPSAPLTRVNMQVLILGAVISLALGIMLAFILDYLENVEKNEEKYRGATPPGDGKLGSRSGKQDEAPNLVG